MADIEQYRNATDETTSLRGETVMTFAVIDGLGQVLMAMTDFVFDVTLKDGTVHREVCPYRWTMHYTGIVFQQQDERGGLGDGPIIQLDDIKEVRYL